ncbi:hypothetical protein DPMN_082373, partial [Dreissena polymorpha]
PKCVIRPMAHALLDASRVGVDPTVALHVLVILEKCAHTNAIAITEPKCVIRSMARAFLDASRVGVDPTVALTVSLDTMASIVIFSATVWIIKIAMQFLVNVLMKAVNLDGREMHATHHVLVILETCAHTNAIAITEPKCVIRSMARALLDASRVGVDPTVALTVLLDTMASIVIFSATVWIIKIAMQFLVNVLMKAVNLDGREMHATHHVLVILETCAHTNAIAITEPKCVIRSMARALLDASRVGVDPTVALTVSLDTMASIVIFSATVWIIKIAMQFLVNVLVKAVNLDGREMHATHHVLVILETCAHTNAIAITEPKCVIRTMARAFLDASRVGVDQTVALRNVRYRRSVVADTIGPQNTWIKREGVWQERLSVLRWNASYMALCEVKLFSADCLAGHYGEYCDLQCNCLDNKRCDAVSGKCFHEGCKPGWQRDSCDTPCDNGFFGMNCSSHCHCRGGVGCDPMSGQCSDKECAPGWIGLKCSTECKRGFFGNKCQSTCRCKENAKCDHINGTCPGYLCADGWRYDNCSIECASGYYGENCSTHCHCNHCHNVNGSCSLYSTQCNDGFRLDGEFCTLADSRPTSEGAIVGGVGAAIAVIIGIAVGLFFFKRRENSKNKHHSSDSTELTDISSVHKQANATSTKAYVETDANAQVYANTESDYYSFKDEVPGIKIHLLWDYIREKTKPGSSFFENEFAKLPSGLIYPHDVAAAVENRGKNRYREMYAYDHSRVPLKKDEPNDSEYINACFINGFEKVNKFIASQGPTKKMIEDFWRMIWQQRVHKIVMLTNLIEMGTLKCMQYWPAQVKGVCTYGGVEISYADIKEMFDYNIRTFDIRRGKESRSVQQFHFKAWPDKDVPETTWCLVDFWRAVDTNDTANISPIVVHCSAGVGRTGAFIAIDSLITQARMEGSIGPLQMVEALRRQRVNMVQTKKQYQFLHEAVADAVLMGTHHVLTREFSIIFEYMMGIEEGSNTTRLEEQFNLIVQSVQEAAVLVDGQASSSQTYGNMETVMSENAYRPQLQERGSKFIQQLGAIFLPTFDNKNALLVCISPTDQHMEDFWSLVEEQHVTTVINMSMPCSSFKNMQLLGRNGSGKTGKFSVKYKQEKKKKGFVERSISFCDENHEDEGGLTTIKEFQLISWPERDDLPTNMQSFFDMIEEILKWQPDLTDRMPILIHCQTGYTRSGLIAVILNEIQRIKSERGQINIVESVKTMKTRCRDVIHSKEQYRFCFEILLLYIKNTGFYQNL